MTARLALEYETNIVEKYRSGCAVDDLLTEFKIDKATLYRVLKRNGVEKRVKWTARTSEQEELIVKRYAEGNSGNSIAVDLGIPITTVWRILKNKSVEIRPDTRVELDVNQKQSLAEMCHAGASINEAVETFGVSRKTVDRILRTHAVSLPLGRRPSCTLNHAAFDVITPESAYWFGFMFADGAVVEDDWGSPAVAINLAEADREHLEKFRSFLGSSHAITRITSKKLFGGPSVYFKARSKQLTAALRARGFITKNEDRFPSVNALASSRDFWRGAIDGDGTVGRGKYPSIELYGHMRLLTCYQQWLLNSGIAILQVKPKSNGSAICPSKMQIYRVSASGINAVEIIEKLYDNAETVLERKFKNARTAFRLR